MATKSTVDSPIIKWYNGKSIFVTGATGFMGKVLVEKLLYACTGIKHIYILIRAKRGKNPQERIETMWTLPMFQRLRESQPDAIKKIIPVIGDLDTEGLGLSQEHLDLLINNVNVLFHLGATLKLEAPLKAAIEQNTAGTARVIDVAKKIKNLSAFLYYSTAFCSADIDVFEEKFYDCRDNPRDVIEVTRWMKDEALNTATASIIAPHPNTYTYSKRLAEKLVAEEASHLPLCIVRPSIVCPAALEPLPGWVDSLNGPMGLIVGAGKGVIRSMHGNKKNAGQFIPVDVAINASIVIAHRIGTMTEKPKEVPVYNLTQNDVIPITIGEIIEKGRDIVDKYPYEMQIWYPDGDFRYKTFMVRLQGRIHDGLELLQFFAVRPWIFKNEKFLGLQDDMTEAEKQIFMMDFFAVPVDEYLVTAVLGSRHYLMKEDPASLPRCRRKLKVLYVIHKLFVFGVYGFLIWTAWSLLPTVSSMFEVAGSYAGKLPVIGTIITK